MVTESQVRELGTKIYEERQRLASAPEVTSPGSPPTRRQLRIEQLDIAAKFNGIALDGVNRRRRG